MHMKREQRWHITFDHLILDCFFLRSFVFGHSFGCFFFSSDCFYFVFIHLGVFGACYSFTPITGKRSTFDLWPSKINVLHMREIKCLSIHKNVFARRSISTHNACYTALIQCAKSKQYDVKYDSLHLVTDTSTSNIDQ